MAVLGKRALWGLILALTLVSAGCMFGPRALESSHQGYSDAVKEVTEEELLLNIVRLRYHDNPGRLDVSSIATQYELSGSAEARPFFNSQAARFANPANSVYDTFTSILPFVGVTGANRPTVSLTPLDDPDAIRGLFQPSTLDGIIFLAETSWPIETVFRLWVKYLNGVPNAPTASGPPRDIVPEFREFQRAMRLLQMAQDRGELRFVRVERVREIGSPLPADQITALAQVEAARNGYEYQQRPDKSWVLVKREQRLEVRVSPAARGSPEEEELRRLLHLKPTETGFELSVGGAEETFPLEGAPQELTAINIYPRSTAQALFYMAHGVQVPPEHFNCGLVRPTLEADGTFFDWQQLTAGLFTVHSVKQHFRPKNAFVAVKYRGYWFYIDESDHESKVSFSLMMVMSRVNLLGTRKGVARP